MCFCKQVYKSRNTLFDASVNHRVEKDFFFNAAILNAIVLYISPWNH